MEDNKDMVRRSAAELITEDGLVIELNAASSSQSQLSRLSRFCIKSEDFVKENLNKNSETQL